MKTFWLTLLHVAIAGAATGVVSAGTGATGFKQIGLIAASSAATSVISLFAKPPGTVTAPPELNQMNQIK